LNVQRECVKMCVEEGNRTLDMIHQESVDHLTRELRNIGFDLGYRVSSHLRDTDNRMWKELYMLIIFHIMLV
jgi:hypothetical protein